MVSEIRCIGNPWCEEFSSRSVRPTTACSSQYNGKLSSIVSEYNPTTLSHLRWGAKWRKITNVLREHLLDRSLRNKATRSMNHRIGSWLVLFILLGIPSFAAAAESEVRKLLYVTSRDGAGGRGDNGIYIYDIAAQPPARPPGGSISVTVAASCCVWI